MTLSSYPYRRRHRHALVVAAGVLALLPVLATASYAAGTVTVTFRGAPTPTGQTACPSTPDITYLKVPPGTTVNFADELGVPATLWANDMHKHLGDNEMVPVTFTTGPTQILLQMLPDCQIDLGTHGKVTVEVTGGASSAPGTRSTAKPRTPQPSTGHPSASGGAQTGTGSGDDDPSARDTSLPDASASVDLGAPVTSPPGSHGASGLLTLVATVCVVGVAAAALRAVVAQRAMLVQRALLVQGAARSARHSNI
jgi:hypothetical protein